VKDEDAIGAVALARTVKPNPNGSWYRATRSCLHEWKAATTRRSTPLLVGFEQMTTSWHLVFHKLSQLHGLSVNDGPFFLGYY